MAAEHMRFLGLEVEPPVPHPAAIDEEARYEAMAGLAAASRAAAGFHDGEVEVPPGDGLDEVGEGDVEAAAAAGNNDEAAAGNNDRAAAAATSAAAAAASTVAAAAAAAANE